MEDDFKYYDDYQYFREYPDAPDYTEMMGGMQLAMADTGQMPEVVVTGQPEPEFKKIEPAGGMAALKTVGEAMQAGAEKIDFDVIGFPGIGTLTLKDLTVGDLGKVLVNIAEGFPPVTGKGQTLSPTMEAIELVNAPVAAGIAKKAIKTIAKSKKAAAATAAAAAPKPLATNEEQK